LYGDGLNQVAGQ